MTTHVESKSERETMRSGDLGMSGVIPWCVAIALFCVLFSLAIWRASVPPVADAEQNLAGQAQADR